MGHYCKICDRVRANEKFGGKGHRQHICKDCKALPKAERDSILQTTQVFDFMHQSRIPSKNIQRLNVLSQSPCAEVAMLAKLVLEVARVKPYKRKRIGFLRSRHPELLKQLTECGLIDYDFYLLNLDQGMVEEEMLAAFHVDTLYEEEVADAAADPDDSQSDFQIPF